MRQSSHPASANSAQLLHGNYEHQPRLSCSPPPYTHDGEHLAPDHSTDLSLISHDKQPFYLRLLQRDNSGHGASRRRLTPSFVPFLWELSPGMPKPNWLQLSSSHGTQQKDAAPAYSSFNFNVPPLAPPPFMQQHHLVISDCYTAHHSRLMKLPSSAKDLSLKSKLKVAFGCGSTGRRRSTASKMLLLEGSHDSDLAGSSIINTVGCSLKSLDMMEDQLGSSSSSSSSGYSDFYQFSGSASSLRGSYLRAHSECRSLIRKPKVILSSWLDRKATSKMKGCCCFHISNCET